MKKGKVRPLAAVGRAPRVPEVDAHAPLVRAQSPARRPGDALVGTAPHGPRLRAGTLAAGGVLLAAALAVYGNAVPNDFIIDDRIIILGDRRVQQFDVQGIFTREYWPGASGNRLYRPLTLLSLAANWVVSHEPWTFRLVNVLLHGVVGFGVFLLLRELAEVAHSGRHARAEAPPENSMRRPADGAKWPGYAAALGAGLLFVVHPIHTTPLNQIVDRADSAAAAGVLLAAWFCLRDARMTAGDGRAGWASRLRPVLAASAAGAALLFKESAVALVGIVVVLDLAFLRAAGNGRWAVAGAPANGEESGRRRAWLWRRVRRCYGPLLLVLLAFAGARTAVLGGVGRASLEISALDNIIAHPEYRLVEGESAFLARWGTPVAVFGKAARLLIWPWPLSWDYSYAAIDNVRQWDEPRLWGGGVALAACAAGLWGSWRRGRVAFVAIGIGLVSYSIVSNTYFLVGSTFAERYLYLPSAGFCMLAGWLFVRGARRLAGVTARRRAAAWGLRAALGAAVLIACSAATVVRNRDFRDNATLSAADVRTQPLSARLWRAMAGAAVSNRRFDAAVGYAAHAQAIYAEDPETWLTAAFAHWGRRDADAALACIQRSGQYGGAASEQLALLAGEILIVRGDYARAIAVLRRLVTKWPANATATAYNNLAWYLLTAEPVELRNPAEALEYARRAVALEPQAGDVLDTYVSALLALGRGAEARRVLDEALPRIPPTDAHRAGLVRKRAEL
ncbi:MAG: tetratricopeptide repeat protein [Planctomycetota bacterium]